MILFNMRPVTKRSQSVEAILSEVTQTFISLYQLMSSRILTGYNKVELLLQVFYRMYIH